MAMTRCWHVAEDGLVEVHATQAVNSMWRAEQLERSFVHLPDDGGIERSTAEVIDRDGRSPRGPARRNERRPQLARENDASVSPTSSIAFCISERL